MLLQFLEGREARGQHEGDLAVEHRLLAGKLLERLGDNREADRPVEAAPAEQRHAFRRFAGDDAIAVIFEFVQPALALRNLVDERRKLRGYEFRLYRAAGFRRGLAV